MLRRSLTGLAIQNLTIFGSGTMGGGIAQISAAAGYNVTLVDVSDEVLVKNKGVIAGSLMRVVKKQLNTDDMSKVQASVNDILSRITTTTNAQAAVKNADLVVEAIVENLAAKNKLWQAIDGAAPKSAIFASNTSSLSIDDQAASVAGRKTRFAGLHFFSPVPMMKLVEVVKGAACEQSVVDELLDYSKKVGKTPVTCGDHKGFIVNRLLIPYMNEAFRLVERGVCSVEDCDVAMRLGAGHPMGPFTLADSIGLDVIKSISHAWHAEEPTNPIFVPSKLIDDKVAEGKLGRKSGEGFYKYTK